MEFTYIIYFSLVLICFIFSRLETKFNSKSDYFIGKYGLLMIITYAIVIGLKYSEGDDFQAYLLHYENIYYGNEVGTYFEEGYLIFCRILSKLRISPPLFFICLSCINITAIYYSVKLVNINILPFAVILFIMSDYGMGLSTNIYRNYLAFSILTMSFVFIIKKKFLWFILVIFIASSFHTSSLLAMPIYFLHNKDIIKKRNLPMCILFFCIIYIIGPYLMSSLWGGISIIGNIIGYGNRIQQFDINRLSIELGSGGGIFLRFIFLLLLIFYHPKLKKFYNSYYLLFFNCYLIGSFLKPIFMLNLNLFRGITFLLYFEYIVISALLYYLCRVEKRIILMLFILSIIIFSFFMSIYYSSNWMSPYVLFK